MHYYSRMADSSRRQFLHAVAASAAAMPFAGGGRLHAAPKHNLPGVLGLELYTLRHLLEKDVPGTLKLVKDWGFEDVEGGNQVEDLVAERQLLGRTVADIDLWEQGPHRLHEARRRVHGR